MLKWLSSPHIYRRVRLKKDRLLILRDVSNKSGAMRPFIASNAQAIKGKELWFWRVQTFSPLFSSLKKFNFFGEHQPVQIFAHNSTTSQLGAFNYEEIANNTLELLAEVFESVADEGSCPDDYDVQLSNGVLTVNIGGDWGTYVINKQSPNRQIWLSSPKSGPKRYDFIDGHWIYSHTGEDMSELLTREISDAFSRRIDFTAIDYASNE
ncbi:frataxin, mitochondrial-like [Rhopilema esculentum]|uniref:frataxin, mitochondrial-like n=1 Tax=Rhopilema esculentum TaxID=499914 RepID=UPI0031CDB3AA